MEVSFSACGLHGHVDQAADVAAQPTSTSFVHSYGQHPLCMLTVMVPQHMMQ